MKKNISGLFVLSFFAWSVFSQIVQISALPEGTRLPPGGLDLLQSKALLEASFWGPERRSAQKAVVPARGVPFSQAIRVAVPQQFDAASAVGFGFKTLAPIAVNDVLYLELWMRAVSMTDEGEVQLVLEQAQSPWKKTLRVPQTVGRDWAPYRIPVRGLTPMEAGEGQVCIHLGGKKQILELGGLRLLNFHRTVDPDNLPYSLPLYEGAEPDAGWRAEAEARIEQYRKADLTVEVIDQDGVPVDGASVHIRMQRHAFPFGSVYKTRWFHGPAAGTGTAGKYRQTFKELFNIGVDEYTMKWPWWEIPSYRAGIEATLDWMAENRIDVRGHCLLWGSYRMMPDDILSLADNPAALRDRILDHIQDEAGACRGKVVAWDVVNESQTHNDVFNILGDSFRADCFTAAHEADPDARLVLNETTPASMEAGVDAFEQQARALLRLGAPIDALGFQSHFSQAGMSIPRVYSILDRFAETGLDLEITEFDFLCADRDVQAAFTRDYMTICFSHPKVISFLVWSFWAGSCYEPDRAMFNIDWSIRPNGQVYKDLVFDKWWTDETRTTDAKGAVSTRGFLGDYLITARKAGHTVSRHMTLSKPGDTVRILFK
jgi:GH35 family endo-1,4-beta-xylanase